MAPMSIKQHKCQDCGATFDRAFNLKRHVRTQHNHDSQDFICDICGKTFSREDHMKAHRKSHFGGDGNINNVRPVSLQCNKCHKTFKRGDSLKRHQREQHKDSTDSFSCETCGKVFQRADHLKSHQKVHTKRPRPDTTEAGKSFIHNYILLYDDNNQGHNTTFHMISVFSTLFLFYKPHIYNNVSKLTDLQMLHKSTVKTINLL